MKILPLFLIFLGCATTITPEEREWREAIDAENWKMCEYAYQKAGRPTIHYHLHGHHVRSWMIRDDLGDNHCKSVLGKYWIEY